MPLPLAEFIGMDYQKARRGELFLTVAIGYVKTSHDRIEKDPDRRVQEAIMLAFNKFAELQTVRRCISGCVKSGCPCRRLNTVRRAAR